MIDAQARLTAADLPDVVLRLGFRGPDVAAVLAAAAAVSQSEADLLVVETLAAELNRRVGDLAGASAPLSPTKDAGSGRWGVEVLAMLACLVTAPEVADFHARRGIDPDISTRSLSELGQQVWVHRKTYGEFGLHTYWWMTLPWSGALYWLGRLQFNLELIDGAWTLSTHVPATGPLPPDAVDESFRQAAEFFGRHFPEYPTVDFYCSSWLLDPQLATVLEPESNLVRFQQRWSLYGEPMRGDEDVLFFVFSRRGPVDLDTLPQDTSLTRAVVSRLREGRHWDIWKGRIPQSTFGIEAS